MPEIKVVQRTTPKNRVIVKQTPSGGIVTNEPVVIKNVPTFGVDTISNMTDVQMAGIANGDVLVYDASTGTFVPHNPAATGGTIDGGSF